MSDAVEQNLGRRIGSARKASCSEPKAKRRRKEGPSGGSLFSCLMEKIFTDLLGGGGKGGSREKEELV